MSETEETSGVKPEAHDPDLLLYDFLKYLATIGLLVLGGVLTFAGSGADISKRAIALTIIIIIAATMSAIIGADRIIVLRSKNKPLDKQVHIFRSMSMWLLTFGTGVFLSQWIGAFE